MHLFIVTLVTLFISFSIIDNVDLLDLNYIVQKFENGKHRLWQDVQLQVDACFRSMNLNEYKFDEFLNIVEIINR